MQKSSIYRTQNILLCKKWTLEAKENLLKLDSLEKKYDFIRNIEIWFHQKGFLNKLFKLPADEIKGLVYYYLSLMYDQNDQELSDKFLLRYFKKCALSSFSSSSDAFSSHELNQIHLPIDEIVNQFQKHKYLTGDYLDRLPLKEKFLFILYHEFGHILYGKKTDSQRKTIVERARLQQQRISVNENHLELSPLLEENTFLPENLVSSKDKLINFWAVNFCLIPTILKKELSSLNAVEGWKSLTLKEKNIFIVYTLFNEMIDWMSESYSDSMAILLSPFKDKQHILNLIIDTRLSEHKHWSNGTAVIDDQYFHSSIGVDHFTVPGICLINDIEAGVLKHKKREELALHDYHQMACLSTTFGLACLTINFLFNHGDVIFYLFNKYKNDLIVPPGFPIATTQFADYLSGSKESFINQAIADFFPLIDKRWVDSLEKSSTYRALNDLFFVPGYLLPPEYQANKYYRTIYQAERINFREDVLFKLLSSFKII